jgi:SAM-dependent methyltransferase/rhamnogalacturonyl hydrolase YesR
MQIVERGLKFMRGALASYGPSVIKRALWDREYSSGKWNFNDNTPGDCLYPYLEKYAANGSILDLGCGSGNTANELAFSAYGSYRGVDISDVALERARRWSEANGRAEKNSFVRADFLNYVPDRRFHVILLRESLYHVPLGSVKSTLDRFSKYLEESGVFIVRIFTIENGRKKPRPTAMVRIIESNFDVLEQGRFGENGATVIVFRQTASLEANALPETQRTSASTEGESFSGSGQQALERGQTALASAPVRSDTGIVAKRSRPPAISVQEIWRALGLVQKWVEDREYRGYEPFDGLSSWARPLTFCNQLAARILQQTIRQCPINLRPLMGVLPQDSTKGRGYMAWGYLMLHRATQQKCFLDKAALCLEWLDTHKARRFQHHSWGNHFDYIARGGSFAKDTPTIVWTSLIGHAYLEAFEVTNNKWFLDIAKSACEWVLELPRQKTGRGDCLGYIADVQLSVHNSNMLGASLLARTAKHTGDQEYFRVARSAMEYSCSRQLPDGSWWYGEEPKFQWIDNFHTGYNLDSLDTYIEATGDAEFRPELAKGLTFYKAHFFEESGRPKYYTTRTYPVDIQCASQSIDTLTLFSRRDPECLEIAEKVAAWSIRNMQDAQGYFYYRRYPLIKAKTPMIHWGQATMFKALAHLFLHMNCVCPADPGRAEEPSGVVRGL